jgi:serine/threonine-protein kinase
LVGRLLEGRYRILDRIARGGMSVVYAAVDERLDRRVAVKVMSSSLSADPAFSDRFAREARAAARLAHVNTVAVYDQGVDDSAGHHVFLVMELVSGRTLRDLIRERHTERSGFSPAEAVSIMEPVLSALSAAHRAGLVHRDIKPENILLSDEGLVKVADFGLARAIDADASSTRTGLMMGTVAYCAPEQLTGGRADQRSDVYSAGIVFFELLTGHPPFRGESAMNVAYQHVHHRVPAPSSRVRGIPTPIDEVVVAATDSDPSGRPDDASAMLAELAEARAELALPVVPVPPRVRRPGPAARPHHSPSGLVSSTGRTDRTATAHTAPTQPDQHPDDAGRTTDLRRPGPPPPVVIPPRRQLSPRMRRRRRRLVAFIAVLLLGALSVGAGLLGVRLWREWNTHVPKLVGQSVTTAQGELRHTGYAVDPTITHVFSETVPEGTVVRTDPGAGARVAQGGTVELVVSLGKDRIAMPDVRNMTLPAAEAALHARGISYDPTPKVQPSVQVKRGLVISTDPRGNAQIRRTATVSFTVSKGPPYQLVPTVENGMPYDKAAAILQQHHFVASRVDEYSSTVPVGGVIAIDLAGQSRPYGDTIPVRVSRGPQYVTVPDYHTLEPLSELQPQLENLGLHVQIVTVLGGKAGRVINVSPGTGSQVAVGGTVKVTIV